MRDLQWQRQKETVIEKENGANHLPGGSGRNKKKKEKKKLPRLSRFGRQWRKRKLGMQLKTSLLVFLRTSSLYFSVVALFYFWQRTLTTRLKNPPFLAGLCYFLTSTEQTNHCLTEQTSHALFSQDGHVFPQRCRAAIIIVISFLSLSPSRSFFPPRREFTP